MGCQQQRDAWFTCSPDMQPGLPGPTLPPLSLHSCNQKCGRRRSPHFPGDVFMAPERAGGAPAQGPMPYLDDDIPLLSVEEEPGERGYGPAAESAGPRHRLYQGKYLDELV